MQTAKDSQSYDKDGKLVFSIELDGTSYDKREDAAKRDAKREIDRAMKARR